MFWKFTDLIKYFEKSEEIDLLIDGKWGLEKESLRVNSRGELALTPHPEVFGDKLSNPYVTTDFSESQLEIITPPEDSIEKVYQSLNEIHSYVEESLKEEYLWPFSMPARLPEESKIPIAKYNNSNKGRENEVYRKGLALRYGKKMQLISGIHYNFSFGEGFWNFLYGKFNRSGNRDKIEFKNDIYFAIVRNFLRYRWLLLYLFGASPVVDSSYDSNMLSDLHAFKSEVPGRDSSTLKNSTSLRMSPLGYLNNKQSSFLVSYNKLDEYIKDLKKLLATPSDEYSRYGIYDRCEQLQLNDRLLQKESEYYSSIRFKRNLKDGESLMDSLLQKGVDYIEIRTLDINPYHRVGVGIDQLYFIHLFVLFCLFEESKAFSENEIEFINKNESLVALFGRNKDLKLFNNSEDKVFLNHWAEEVLNKMMTLAAMIDKRSGKNIYQNSIKKQQQKIKDLHLLPSSKIIKDMKNYNEDFINFGLRRIKNNLAEVV